MAINIPRSQISQAAAQRRTLLPASEAGAALRGFGRLFEQGAKLAGGMLNKQLQQEHKLWAEESKIKFEELEDQYLQNLNAIGTEEDLGDMDREASIWGAYHDNVDALESAGLEAAAQLSPRSQRRIQKEITNTTRIMRENPGSALRSAHNTVELAQLDFSNQRALNNYSGIPIEDVGRRAALDIARADDMVRRRVIPSDRLSQVLTTTLNGARVAYFSEGYQGRIDFALQIFGEPGSGGLSDLPESVKKRERANILENRERYLDYEGFLAPEDGAMELAQLGQIAGHFPMIMDTIVYEPPKRDWQSVVAWKELMSANGLNEEAAATAAALEVAWKSQSRINKSGVDAASVLNSFITPNMDVLNSIDSTPGDLNNALSKQSEVTAAMFGKLLENPENATEIFTNSYNHFGGLLPEFGKQLNNFMAEDNLNAWEVASHLLGRGTDSLGRISTRQLGDDSFSWTDAVIGDIVVYNTYRAMGEDPISALRGTRTEIDEKLLAEPTGKNESTTLRSSPEKILETIKDFYPKLSDIQLEALANQVAANQEPALRRVAGNSDFSALSHKYKKDLVVTMATNQFTNRHPIIYHNDVGYAWRVRLPAENRQNSRGEDAISEAWMVEELVDLFLTGAAVVRDAEGNLVDFGSKTREDILEGVISQVTVVPLNDDQEMRSTGISKYKLLITGSKDFVSDTGFVKNKGDMNLVFEPKYQGSLMGQLSESKSLRALVKSEEPAPEGIDTGKEFAAFAAQAIVGADSDQIFTPGTVGSKIERVWNTGFEYASKGVSRAMDHALLAAETTLVGIMTWAVEKDAGWEEVEDAMALFAQSKSREIEDRYRTTEMENSVNYRTGQWYQNQSGSRLLSIPSRRDRFDEIVKALAKDLSLGKVEEGEVEVPLLGKTAVRPGAQKLWASLRAAGRGQVVFQDPKGLGDEYVAMLTKLAFEVLQAEVQLEIEDDASGFMKKYEEGISANKSKAYYFTPDSLKSHVQKMAERELGIIREVYRPPTDGPAEVGAYVETSQFGGDIAAPKFNGIGERLLPSILPQPSDVVEVSIRPPTQQEEMFNSLIDEGTGSIYWYGIGQNPKAVQITNKWEKENASVGNLMPRTGNAYIPPGYTTDVEAVQQVWNMDPKKSAQTVSDFFYPVLGTTGKEKLYGKFGALPGVAAEDRKPGWIKRYYTAQSKSLSETFGTDPFMEAKGLQAGIASIMPGKGASVIMGLTLDQFFTVLEAGVNRYELERESE